jgi:hypothetical protein
MSEEGTSATGFSGSSRAISCVRPRLPNAVDGYAPCDPGQPRLRIFHRPELRAVAQHAHKGFLRGIFGVVVAAEHRVGDAVNQPGMFPDKRFEHLVGPLDPTALVFSPLNRCHAAQDRLSRRHSFALSHEDRPEASFVQEFSLAEREGVAYLRGVMWDESVGRTLLSAALEVGGAAQQQKSKSKSTAADTPVRPTRARSRP